MEAREEFNNFLRKRQRYESKELCALLYWD